MPISNDQHPERSVFAAAEGSSLRGVTGVMPQAPREHLQLLWRDLAYAVRFLRRSPGFTVIAVLALALGIGTNTAIFGLADGMLFKPLPFRDPQGLVLI